MSTADVDWTAVERGSRRQTVVAVLGVATFLGSLVALQGGYAGLEGPAGWIAAGVFAALAVVAVLVARGRPGSHQRSADARRVQYALRHHVDPGEPLRPRADVAARQAVRVRWLHWYWLLAVAALLAGGRWDRPAVAVPAALVLVAVVAGWAVVMRRQLQAAQRWVADPPGPPREDPELTAVERWTSGRRVLLVALGVVVVGVIAGFTIALVG